MNNRKESRFLLSGLRENLSDLRVKILFNAETAEKDAEVAKHGTKHSLAASAALARGIKLCRSGL